MTFGDISICRILCLRLDPDPDQMPGLLIDNERKWIRILIKCLFHPSKKMGPDPDPY